MNSSHPRSKTRLTHHTSRIRPNLHGVALGLIIAVGIALRAYHLGFKTLKFDEALFYWIGQGNLQAILSENARLTSEPPLFALLTAIVSRISSTEVALRIVPFLAGVAAIPAIYLLASRFLTKWGAVAAALMVTFAPSQITRSQQVREYSLSSLFTILALLSFVNFLDKKTWRSSVFMAVTISVGMYIHYSLALILLGINIVFLIRIVLVKDSRKQLFLNWLLAQMLVGLATLALYGLALRQQLSPVLGAWYIQPGLWAGSSIRSAIGFAYGGIRDLMLSAYPGYVFTLLFYLGSVVLILFHRKTVFPYLVVAPIAVVVGSSLLRLYPLGGGPQDIFMAPLVILVAASGVDYLVKVDPRGVTVAVFLGLLVWRVVPSLIAYYPEDGNSSVGRIVERVAADASPGDPVYLCLGDDPALRYYVYVRYPMPRNPIVTGIRGPEPRDYLDQVDAMLADYGRAWMIMFPPCGDMSPMLEHIAQDWHVDLVEKRYPDTELYYVH